ncbi:MAG: T9SS type A sorting domain-containing protein [Saprospiraceae bacterium]|nr:T9SS type A sorting domain-containing protein [Saprospiraceae bacterium]
MNNNNVLLLKCLLILALGFTNWNSSLYAQRILEVGQGRTYADPAQAARNALPGDTILIYPGSYRGSFFIENLKGTPNAWITMKGTNRDAVIFAGGSQSMQFTDAQYLFIQDLTITGQTGNGLNIDDGGTYNTPTKRLVLKNLIFRDMAASGNNDMLKLSGLDSFQIINCSFTNGATGGSGIDMVGCHAGDITQCKFTNQGSNSIQAKGATSEIHINRNHFINGGQRSINLGGSTGVDFFRPLGANYEARNLLVSANIFEGSMTPIAYVGCRNVTVINNTIIRPERWIMRILQESPDTSFYQSSAYNYFINNIVVVNSSLSTDVNIGPNTLPSSFTFENNLWYHETNANYRPTLPVTERNGITRRNPGFVMLNGINYGITPNSPAYQAGALTGNNLEDYFGRLFQFFPGPSIGALEYIAPNQTQDASSDIRIHVYPNPTSDFLLIESNEKILQVNIVDMDGRILETIIDEKDMKRISVQNLKFGVYILEFKTSQGSSSKFFYKL